MTSHIQPGMRKISSLLYDGILSKQDWYDGIATFSEAVGGLNFHQLTVDVRQGSVLESIASEHNEEAVENYDRHYALIDERVPIAMQLGQGQVMLDHEHFSDRHMSRSALYADCLAPQGMKYTMGLMLRVEGSVQQYLGFMRAKDQAHFSQRERDFASQLMPDLIRAARLRAHASDLAQQAALGLTALAALPQGIALVDAQCRIQYANPTAERMFASAGALVVQYGQLSCHDESTKARLQSTVAAACTRQGTGMAGTFHSGPGLNSLVITVMPVNTQHLLAASHQSPLALLILRKPTAPGDLDPHVIAEILGLSPVETRLALSLEAGKTVKDFAESEKISWHTARTHIRNLLRKSGCHRQLELVALLQSLRLG